MENQRYMQEGVDVKRILLLLKEKLWMVVVAAVIGALAGGGVYLFIHLVFASERDFQSVSKLYLNFNCDPEDFNQLAYNGYTWNDLMATDPILNYTMEALPDGMDRNMVIDATKAEILSDIRLLTITITANEPDLAAQIMEATQKALVHLGEADALFDSIEVYRTEGPQQIVWDNRTVNAAATGAVIGLFVVLLVMAFYYVLDDSVYVARDVEKRYGIPVFGVFLKNGGDKAVIYGKEFAANYSYLCREVKTAALMSMDAGEDAETAGRAIEYVMDMEKAAEERNVERRSAKEGSVKKTLSGKMPTETEMTASGEMPTEFPRLVICGSLEEDAEIYRRMRKTDGVILTVRYGGGNGKRLERALGNLEKQDCKVLGAVIVNADERFLKLYYMRKDRERNHK